MWSLLRRQQYIETKNVMKVSDIKNKLKLYIKNNYEKNNWLEELFS